MRRPLVIILLILLAAPILFWFYAASVKRFNMDEMEHAHAAYLLADGQLPYRDFFEHHPPLLYHAIKPLYQIFGARPRTMFVFRYAMIACLIATLAGIYLAAKKTTGSLTAALLACVGWAWLALVAEKGIELRPDPPAVACMALALGLYLHLGGADRLKAVIIGALLWGLAGAFTQKMIFPFLGASLYHFLACAFDKSMIKNKRIIHIAAWPVIAALPFALCMLYYAAQSGAPIPEPFYGPAWIRSLPGALPVMMDRVVFWNLHWANKIRVLPVAYEVVHRNWAFWLTAVAGFFIILSRQNIWEAFRAKNDAAIIGDPTQESGARLIALTTLGAAAGVILNPVPYFQYFLTLAAPSAILVGYAFSFAMRRAQNESDAKSRRNRLTAAVLLVALLTLPALSGVPKILKKKCDNQVEAINFFTTKIDPTWKIMDGWTGFGVFNPSAWYYYFLHLEIRKMLPESVQIEGAKDALANARVVIRDPDLCKLPAPVQQIIAAQFYPHNKLIYFRK